MSENNKPSKHFYFAIVLAICFSVIAVYQVNKIPDPAYPDFDTEFTLQSANGPYGLKDMKGKVGIMLFGYTHCPDVCPATLVNFGKALELLDEDERAKVRPLFITLDPERDSVEVTDKYARYFHPQIIGLSGSREEVDKTAKTFFIGSQVEKPNEQGNYAMKHSTTLYILRPDGLMGDMIGHNTPPEELVDTLRRWLPWAE